MGTAKKDLQLGGRSFLELVVSAASCSFEKVFVVIRAGQEMKVPEPAFVLRERPHRESAPLFGIAAALEHSGGVGVWILATDYPLLEPSLLNFLRDEFVRSEADLLVPEVDGKAHMLCAGYSAKLKGAIDGRLAAGEFRLRDLVPVGRTRVVQQQEIVAHAPLETLWNVNSPQDYARIGGLHGRGNRAHSPR